MGNPSQRGSAAALSEADLIYQIRTHLLYELKWLIFAASRFAQGRVGEFYLAAIDSATVHARNLFEFAATPKSDVFSLKNLGGTPKKTTAWDRWANNRVTHMLWELDRAPWPDGLDNSRSDRLMVMADVALKRLEDGGVAIQSGSVRDAFFAVVNAARDYWNDPTDARHAALQALYDDSRDGRPY